VRCEERVSKVQWVQKINFPLSGERQDDEITDFPEVSGISLDKVRDVHLLFLYHCIALAEIVGSLLCFYSPCPRYWC
jgi:hypothetical protein